MIKQMCRYCASKYMCIHVCVCACVCEREREREREREHVFVFVFHPFGKFDINFQGKSE